MTENVALQHPKTMSFAGSATESPEPSTGRLPRIVAFCEGQGRFILLTNLLTHILSDEPDAKILIVDDDVSRNNVMLRWIATRSRCLGKNDFNLECYGFTEADLKLPPVSHVQSIRRQDIAPGNITVQNASGIPGSRDLAGWYFAQEERFDYVLVGSCELTDGLALIADLIVVDASPHDLEYLARFARFATAMHMLVPDGLIAPIGIVLSDFDPMLLNYPLRYRDSDDYLRSIPDWGSKLSERILFEHLEFFNGFIPRQGLLSELFELGLGVNEIVGRNDLIDLQFLQKSISHLNVQICKTLSMSEARDQIATRMNSMAQTWQKTEVKGIYECSIWPHSGSFYPPMSRISFSFDPLCLAKLGANPASQPSGTKKRGPSKLRVLATESLDSPHP